MEKEGCYFVFARDVCRPFYLMRFYTRRAFHKYKIYRKVDKMKKRYRAVIIDGRKLIKNTAVAGVATLIALCFIFGAKISGVVINKNQVSQNNEIHTGNLLSFPSFDNIVKSELSWVSEGEQVTPVFNEKNADRKAVLPETGKLVGLSGELPIRAIDSSQKKAMGEGKAGQISIKNETSYKVNAAELLSEDLNIDMTNSGPKVLIVHTHGSEAYTGEGKEFYIKGTGDRNTDTSFNVVAVGDEVTKVLEKKGIEVIHDRSMHDVPNYNKSYASSLSAIEKYKAEYPSICVVLDIHRDAIVYGDGTKAKTVTEIDGKNTAQLMFVVGTNAGGLTHDNWRENLKFSVKLQDAISRKYPSLMRSINLRRERFNGHTTKGSVIIEVGTSGNTLSEAKRGASLAAAVIGDFLKGI